MKNIKFRAWDNISKRMIMFDNHKTGILYSCGEFFVSTGYDSHDNPTFDVNTYGVFEVMQYTNLKDKNGKEIFEGDVLINKDSKKGVFQVKYLLCGYDAVYKGNFALSLYPVLNELDGCEIIGNIHQDKELLNNG